MQTAREVTVQSLKAAVDVDGCLTFLEKHLNGANLPVEVRALGTAKVAAVRAQARRSELLVAVVGEFSSGKSTLINAFIRDALLPADVLAGTTAAVVTLRPGPKQLSAQFLDGQIKNMTEGPEFHATLQRLITDEPTARGLSGVTISHPAPFLQEGILLIDLPGSNVEYRRHAELAGLILKEKCDTAIVVISANIPVSESLTEFLRIHAADILHRCIFVVSKIDQISPAERGKVIATVTRRLATKLQIASPLVLAVSGATFLGEVVPPASQAQELREQFLQAESRILEVLCGQLPLILLERSAALLLNLFSETETGLKVSLERLRHDREKQAGVPISTLRERITEGKKKFLDALEPRLEATAHELLRRFTDLKQHTLDAAKATLDVATSRSLVIRAATSGTDYLMVKVRNELWEKLHESLAGIASSIRTEAAFFEDALLSQYPERGLSKVSTTTNLGAALVPGSWPAWKSPVLQKPAANTGRLLLYTGAGFIAGGLAGMMTFILFAATFSEEGCILGFVALGLGPIVGGILGNLLSEDIEPLRTSYSQQIDSSIRGFFNESESIIMKMLEKANASARETLDALSEEYSKKYESLIDQSIADRRHSLAEIEHREKQIFAELLEVERRGFSLRHVRSGLEKLNRI